MAQLYKKEFSEQEKAKEEHIKQAKEKVIAEEKRLAEERKRVADELRERAILEAREREQQELGAKNALLEESSDNSKEHKQATETPVQSASSVIGSDWSQVSPEQASAYMSAKTGVSASTWQAIIYAESTNNPTVTNSIGCYGYLQLHPVHGSVSTMTPQQYLDTAVSVFNSQGLSAWEVTTNGMVN